MARGAVDALWGIKDLTADGYTLIINSPFDSTGQRFFVQCFKDEKLIAAADHRYIKTAIDIINRKIKLIKEPEA